MTGVRAPINAVSRQPFDVCIVGAGIIGLSLARAVSERWPKASIVVLEQNAGIGQETSSRNSEVIHAGLYYPPGSLKSRLCVRGNALLYEYCAQHYIPHQRLGKLIVAQAGEEAALENVLASAQACGVASLRSLTKAEISALEPRLQSAAALWSPDTGIVDSHALMQRLQQEAEQNGALIAPHSRFLAAHCQGPGVFDVDVDAGDTAGGDSEPFRLRCRMLINCAGLAAHQVAGAISGIDKSLIPERHLVKGHYFALSGRSPFRHLIYPVPDASHRGLGIHATLDLAGQCRFGPDIEPITDVDYTVDESRKSAFADAIRRYYPALDETRLHADYAGIRPRLGSAYADFMIQDEYVHGCPGLIQLFGIESPGLTASLALAELVTLKLQDQAPL
ncbi:MAG: FAD-dependent oxidoreductase [Gammaproteobacteria bacterium]|nr:FAD-dependent oxidoreductase [Gammaproteobacteria bacterium]|tara:strand:+ start:864 stop:2039 length:1176 start_codon:yes stop_codon:yes gene_type:complete